MSQEVIPGPGSRPAPPIALVTRADAGICLLADHLDAALAAGEDLHACKLTVGAPHSGMAPDEIRAEQAELRGFIERVRALEMALVSRLLQARRRAAELPRLDDAHSMILNLLMGGTAELSEAVREVGDRVEQQFLTGSGHLAYLRSRGFIEPEAACLGAIADLQVTDAFLVYGRLPLGALLDLVAAFLDKLDVVFDLYPEAATVDDEVPDAGMAGIGARLGELRAAAEQDAINSLTIADPPSPPPNSPEDTAVSIAPSAERVIGDSVLQTVAETGVSRRSADEASSALARTATETIEAAATIQSATTEPPATLAIEPQAAPGDVPMAVEVPGTGAMATSLDSMAASPPFAAGLADGDSGPVPAKLRPEVDPVDAASTDATSEAASIATPPRSLTAALAEVGTQSERLADRLRACTVEPPKAAGPGLTAELKLGPS